ncbi:MAG TPA: 50S ribosomal protein L11 methyltransferase [Flavisolibacter sp.]|nr:50S ribosomal protein L11 methyltransferase [Flavisolibacter sp.]
MGNSICISIRAAEPAQEILISQLAELGAEGFEQTEEVLLAYFPALDFKSYEVNELLKTYSFDTSTVEEQNWNEVWESNFQPVVVDDFCAIRAEFHPSFNSVVEHEIVITPKMSFGTGHHATTFMMIRQMRGMDFAGKKVFDFGTGTGILAILAEKLGAIAISAIDVDEWSIRNAGENAERNKCSHIELALSTEVPAGKFDIILANINRHVILQYLPLLKKALNARGYLLLSGLMTSDEQDVVEACSGLGLQFAQRDERSNWISLLYCMT